MYHKSSKVSTRFYQVFVLSEVNKYLINTSKIFPILSLRLKMNSLNKFVETFSLSTSITVKVKNGKYLKHIC